MRILRQSVRISVSRKNERTTALAFTQSHDPVGEAKRRVRLHRIFSQPEVAPHDHVAPALAPSVL